MENRPSRLWGEQNPFERNHLQRTMTLIGLGGVFAVTVTLLFHAGVSSLLGISLICAGILSALAALSRHEYVRETRLGFVILETRGGSFVLGSSLAFVVVGVLVARLVFLG